MNLPKKYNLLNTCRTCTKDLRWKVGHELDLIEDQDALNAVFELLELKITPDDGLPQQICDKCNDMLIKIYSFRSVCQKSQIVLERFFSTKNQNNIDIQRNGTEKNKVAPTTEISTNSETTPVLDPLNVREMVEIHDSENVTFKYVFEVDHDYSINTDELDEQIEISESHRLENKNEMCEEFLIKIKDEVEGGSNSHDDVNEQSNLNMIKQSMIDDTLTKTERFICNICDQQFCREISLKRHEKDGKCSADDDNEFVIPPFSESQIDKPFPCPICRRSYVRADARDKHFLSAHFEGSSFECDICHKTFKTLHFLKNHIRLIHIFSEYKCPSCPLEFTRKHIFQYHLKSHDPDKKYKCKYCEKSFLQSHHLSDHERSHTNQRPFLCKLCGKSFKLEYILKEHERRHTEDKPFWCKMCDATFRLNSELRIHQHTQQHIPMKPHKCDVCCKSFRTEHTFRAHRCVPLMEKNKDESLSSSVRGIPYAYACQLCSRRFKLPSSLTLHMQKSHNEERKFKCNECGNTFKRLTDLRTHMNFIHLGKKPYSCEYCDKRFSQTGDRDAHIRVHHTYERPFECDVCNKRFNSRKALRLHMRIHAGNQSYQCEICQKRYYSYNGLAFHTITKHQRDNTENEESVK